MVDCATVVAQWMSRGVCITRFVRVNYTVQTLVVISIFAKITASDHWHEVAVRVVPVAFRRYPLEIIAVAIVVGVWVC